MDPSLTNRHLVMDDKQTPEGQRAEGTFDKLKGRVKEAAGAITNDTSTRLEGQGDQVKGTVKDKVGEARQNLRDKI